MPKIAELTPKEAIFVDAYCATLSYTKAAQAAGYKSPGIQGPNIAKRPKVRAELDKRLNQVARKYKIKRNGVIEQLSYALNRDVREFFDDDGIALTPDKLPKSAAAVVDYFEQTEEYDTEGNRTIKTKYKLVPKLGAIDLALKHKGMLTEKVQHEHNHKGKITVDWEKYYETTEGSPDPVKERIAKAGRYLDSQQSEEDEIVDADYTVKELVETQE